MSTDPERRSGLVQQVLARRDAFIAARDLYVTAVLATSRTNADIWLIDATDYRRERPIFVQYTNPEILACYGKEVRGRYTDGILSHALTATRLALLLTDGHLVIPASYIFEIPWFHSFLSRIEPLIHLGVVRYTAPVPELGAYQSIKANEYRHDRENPYLNHRLRGISADSDLMWVPRQGMATAADIGTQWRRALQSGGDLHGVLRRTAQISRRSTGHTERFLAKTPERLEGQAFIKRFVEDTIPVRLPPVESRTLALFLSRAYLKSYILSLDASIITDLPLGELSCGLQATVADLGGRLLSARRLDLLLRWTELDDFVHRIATWEQLDLLRSSSEFGLIACALYQNNSTVGLRLAIVRAKRSPSFRRAGTYDDASSTIRAIADQIANL